MTGLLSAWAVEAGIVTWRSFHRDHRPPLPADFVAVFILFGALGLLAEVPNMKGTAAVTGWGIVLASAFSLVPRQVPGAAQFNGQAKIDPTAVQAQPGNKSLTASLARQTNRPIG